MNRSPRYDNAIRFSPDKVTDIIRMANLTLVDNSSYPTLYNMEPGLVFASRHGSLNITMDITLDNGFQVTIPSYELLRPLRGLDSTTGALTVNENYDEIAVYRVDSSGTNKDKFGSPVGNSAVFGKVFLSQVSSTRGARKIPERELTCEAVLTALGVPVCELRNSQVLPGVAESGWLLVGSGAVRPVSARRGATRPYRHR